MHLKSSTLVESIIAMIIIMMVMAMSFQVFLNKGGIGTNHRRLLAMILVENVYNKTLSGETLAEEDLVLNSITAQRTIEPYPGNSNLFVMEIKATDIDSTVLFCKTEIFDAHAPLP